MRKTAIFGLSGAITALVSMVIGHTGENVLDWKLNHISTYASMGHNGAWVTASIIISASAILCISILISKDELLGASPFAHILPVFCGASVAGLLMLAYFKETAMTLNNLKGSGFASIRQQSFHDAGLLVFFYSSIILSALSGLFCTIFRKSVGAKAVGVLITCMGLSSYYFMSSQWTALMGIYGPVAGIKQRAALFSLWLAMTLLISLGLKGSPHAHPLEKGLDIARD